MSTRNTWRKRRTFSEAYYTVTADGWTHTVMQVLQDPRGNEFATCLESVANDVPGFHVGSSYVKQIPGLLAAWCKAHNVSETKPKPRPKRPKYSHVRIEPQAVRIELTSGRVVTVHRLCDRAHCNNVSNFTLRDASNWCDSHVKTRAAALWRRQVKLWKVEIECFQLYRGTQ